MTLLDDAKQLASVEPTRHTQCIHCSALRDFPDCVEDHATDCPWLSLPRIVAALEAAERLLSRFDDYDFPVGSAPIPRDIRSLIEDLGIALEGDIQ